MQADKTCEGCFYYKPCLVYKKSCYRPKSFVGKIILPQHRIGFSIEFETAGIEHYDNRVDGDTCGPDRKHYRSAK